MLLFPYCQHDLASLGTHTRTHTQVSLSLGAMTNSAWHMYLSGAKVVMALAVSLFGSMRAFVCECAFACGGTLADSPLPSFLFSQESG